MEDVRAGAVRKSACGFGVLEALWGGAGGPFAFEAAEDGEGVAGGEGLVWVAARLVKQFVNSGGACADAFVAEKVNEGKALVEAVWNDARAGGEAGGLTGG